MEKESPGATLRRAVNLTAPPHTSRPFSGGVTGLDTKTDDGGSISERLPMGPLVSNKLRKLFFLIIQDPDLGPNYLYNFYLIISLLSVNEHLASQNGYMCTV